MYRKIAELEEFLDHILSAPPDAWPTGRDERETIESQRLDPEVGLVGDNRSKRGEYHPGAQLALINSRVFDAAAMKQKHWPSWR